MNSPHLRRISIGVAALVASWAVAFVAAANDTAVEAAEGLWSYTTLQAGGKGEHRPLTGVILFKDGVFAQQSIFDGEPFETQGAMAHAGPYRAGPKGVHMLAEQTISIAPGQDPPLRFRRNTEHDIAVERDGESLTIVFDSGTVQKFKRIGPANGRTYELEKGVLALLDDHFVLVSGDEQGVVTGYGKYRRSGSNYDLEVIRWSEATPAKAKNRRDIALKATFDGKTFALADGRTFRVAQAKE